jgi:AcrR family transcriptional regulator
MQMSRNNIAVSVDMSINRSSRYTVFGDKEALFRKAIDRYADGPAAYVRKSVEESTTREVIESLLHGALELLSNPRSPRGCLSVRCALANGTGGETVKQALIDWRKRGDLVRRTIPSSLQRRAT